MYTDNTILTKGEHKFTALCRISAHWLLGVHKNGHEDRELIEYIKLNLDKIKDRAEDKISAPKLIIPCFKFMYESEKAAKKHLRAIQEKEQKNQHKPIRAYECEKCGGWHLTSKQKEEVMSITVYQIIESKGFGKLRKRQRIKIGSRVLKAWMNENKYLPKRIEQKEQVNTYTVYQYPASFRAKIEEIIDDYVKMLKNNPNFTVI